MDVNGGSQLEVYQVITVKKGHGIGKGWSRNR